MNFWKTTGIRIAFALLLGALGFAPAASAATFNIYLNTDLNPTTGCDVTADGEQFQGAEWVLTTTVQPTGGASADVTSIAYAACVNPATDTFGAPTALPGPPTPVGIGNGTDGLHVVETYFPLSVLGPDPKPPIIRLGVTSSDGTGEDAMLTARPTGNQPILFHLQIPLGVPSLSEWGLILLGLLLAASALATLRRRRSAVALLLALVLLGAAGLVWAATSDLDGGTLGEWMPENDTRVAEDNFGDGPAGADLRALFATKDAVNIYFRVDTSLVFNTPPTATDDTATVIEDSGANTIPVLANDSDPDGDPFTIGSVTQPANGTVAITNAGADLTYTPNADYCNNPPGTTLDTFTYTLNPGGDSATVTVTVNCVDDNPTAVNDAATVAEDSGANTIDVLANDTDPDGGTKLITAVTQPTNGTVVITNGGADLTYAPNANYCNNPPVGAPDTFTYTITGGSIATVSVTVNCSDDPPTAVNDAATVNEDSGANTINVQANDTDVDGGTNTITSVTQPANGTVVITNGGADLTYAPNADYCNNPPGTTLDTFTYTLTPGGSTATVTVTVTCVEDNPVAVDDAATVTEDSGASTINVLANDTDPDGGAISITSVTQPANGTVVITNGGADLTYAPNANYCNNPPGTTLDTFTYTLTPGGSTATVSVTVTCVEDNPVAVNDTATVNEDSGANTINVQANDTDVDGGTNTITSVTQPANGAVVITNGGADLTYAPNANYCNSVSGIPDTFTYTLTPGGSTATVSVTVTCVDDPPAAVNDVATVNEDSGANTINVQANDVDLDGGTNTIGAVTQPANGTVVITNGGLDLTYAPNANYCNTPPGTTLDTFSYTLTPGGSTATVTVTVNCLNDAPAIDLDADDDKGTTGANFAVTFTEGDAAKLIEDPVDSTVTDIDSATLASLTVTITNLLDTGFETLAANVGGTSITANYVPATGVLTLTGPDTVANFQTVLRTITYLNTDNDPDASAPRSITFVANDGATNSNTATSTVTVVAVDSNPVAVNDAATVNEDSGANTINVLANDTDADGGPISITSVTQPANGTVVITNGGADLTYAPNANYCNNPPGSTLETFTYTLSPGGSTATVTVTVNCVEDNPVAVNDAATVTEDSGANTINVQANDTDVDGGTNTITSVTQPANGTVVITNAGADLTYTPNANYCNTPPGTTLETFTYTLSPGGSTATVTVTVTCVEDNPVAVNDAATVVEDSGATTINVQANDTDVDGGTNTITSVTQPANGTVAITNGGADLTYTPNANYCNTPPGSTLDTFTYTLTPGGSTATVTVTVTCVDDPPTAVNDSATVNEDSGANTINVQANDTDVDGGTNTITSVTQPANGTVVITNGGADLTYAPNANYCNNPPGTTLETFTYTLTPGGSTATVTVTVTCVNDAPVADNDTFDFIGNTELRVDVGAGTTPHALETTPSTFGVVDGDSDPVENDAIAVSSITVGACTDNTGPTFDCSDPAVGTVHMQTNGRFSFEPAAGDTGATETFTYVLTDTGTPPASTTGTVTLTRFERVWYVKNDDPLAAPALDNGTSVDPFETLAGAETASSANDYIFVYFGDGTTADQNAGITLKNGQHLIGEHAGLSIPVNLNGNGSPTVLHVGTPGSRPLLDDTVANAVEGVHALDVIPTEIVGLNLAGNVNAINWQTTAAFAGTGTLTIRDNVIRSAAGDGVDVNLAGTGATRLAFRSNSLTSTGNGLDIQETGTGSLTITSFEDNTVSGDTVGTGININTAIFDSVPGGGFDTVSGGTTVIGSLGNGVGGAGMMLTSVQGSLNFVDIDIFAEGGAGFAASGTGAFNGPAGTGLGLSAGLGAGPIEATGGPAVDISNASVNLQLSTIKSTNSATTGVSLVNMTDFVSPVSPAIFTANAGSSITNATGTDFNIDGGTATVTYAGTITDDVGQLVRVANTTGDVKSFTGAITDGDDGDGSGVSLTNNTGATISFSGGLVLNTGANSAFTATGGGTLTVCDENPCNGAAAGALINKVTTTSGTALNVANTNIGANNLEFRSISAGTGAGSSGVGISLDTTGTAAGNGGLIVRGTGTAGSGGTIQHKTGVDGSTTAGIGIYLNRTKAASFSRMQLNDFDNFAIRANEIVGLTLSDLVVSGLNGNSAGADEGSLFIEDAGGTIGVSNTNVSGGFEDNLRVHYDNGTSGPAAAFNVTGSTFRDLQSAGNNSLVNLRSTTAASSSWDVDFNFTGSCVFENDANTLPPGGTENFADGILVTFEGPFSHTLNVQNATFHHLFQGMDIASNFSADVAYTIKDNTITFTEGVAAIALGSGSSSTNQSFLTALIQGNNIGTSGSAQSGNRLGLGIALDMRGEETAQFTLHGNTIRRTEVNGIQVIGQTAADGNLDIQITNNNIAEIEDDGGGGAGVIYGIEVTTNTGTSHDICLDARNNDSFNINAHDIRVRQSNAAVTFAIEGLTGSGASDVNVENYLVSQNPGNTADVRTGASIVNYTSVASCTTPPTL